MNIHNYNNRDSLSLQATHCSNPSKNILVYGIMIKKACTLSFFINIPVDHQLATIYTSSNKAIQEYEEYQHNLQNTINHWVFLWQKKMLDELQLLKDKEVLQSNSDNKLYAEAADFPYTEIIQKHTRISQITKETECIIWD